ncbi:virulence RhuM family protein [Patescibacteria group bacterium]|nr:virulence RhuM family protein [Patescibacteria group bacterium]
MEKKKTALVPNNSFTEFLLYTTPNGKVKVEIFLRDENIWLTQEKIGQLFGVQRPAITKHLKNIFQSKELVESSVSSILEHTADDGKTYKTKFYNLDAIISVGYRVNSAQATHFRIWATERLKEYIIKGFVMDDERLKNPGNIFGKDYFEEQLARIRDIRSSERRFYQKITDIYAQCSADYVSDSEVTKQFFATVQNKLHWAINRQTAAEIVHSRADYEKQNMGLTSRIPGTNSGDQIPGQIPGTAYLIPINQMNRLRQDKSLLILLGLTQPTVLPAVFQFGMHYQ